MVLSGTLDFMHSAIVGQSEDLKKNDWYVNDIEHYLTILQHLVLL